MHAWPAGEETRGLLREELAELADGGVGLLREVEPREPALVSITYSAGVWSIWPASIWTAMW